MPRIREKPELGKIDTYTKKLPALSYVFKEFSPSFFFFGAGRRHKQGTRLIGNVN